MWKLILLILAGLYTLNPYDILPDFIVGWGWLDDLIIWILLWRYFMSRKKKFADYGRYDQSAGGRFQNRRRGNYSDHGRSDSKDQYSEDNAQWEWDPHRVLGIDRSASVEEIKHAYRDLASKYHPDKLEHLGDEFKALAETRFKEIQQAYQELTGKGS
jgi:DnaJ like chaperone protein